MRTVLLKKLSVDATPLSEVVGGRILWGVKTGYNDAFVIDGALKQQLIREDPSSAALIKPLLIGEDVRRYETRAVTNYLIYPHPNVDIDKFRAIRRHLLLFKDRLVARATKTEWYELQQASVAMVPVFESDKIVYPEIAPVCRFTIDVSKAFSNNKTFVLPTSDRRLLGVLNSRVGNFFFRMKCVALEGRSGSYLEFRAQYVGQFPVRTHSNKKTADYLATLVDSMLSLHNRLSAEQLPQRREQIQREIDATDRQIDALVYQLYGLTDDEIAIVEAATA